MNDGIYPPEFHQRPHAEEDAKAMMAEARLLFWKRFMIFLAVLATAACITTVTVSVLLIRQTQISGRPILESAQQAARSSQQGTDRILDCTTPGRKCWAMSNRRTAEQIARLIGDNRRAAAAASACAVQLAPRLAAVDPHRGFLLVRACQRERLTGQ